MASAALTCTGRGGNTPVIQAHTPFCCNKNKGQAATKCRYHPATASSEINHKNKALGASSQLRVSRCFCDKLWATSAMLNCKGFQLPLQDRLEGTSYTQWESLKYTRLFESDHQKRTYRYFQDMGFGGRSCSFGGSEKLLPSAANILQTQVLL